MKTPYIVAYRPEHYDGVREVLIHSSIVPPDNSEEIENGIGLVAFDPNNEESIIGFVWALAAKGQHTAYVDYFGVDKGFRGTRAGYTLLLVLAAMLRDRLGINKVIASIAPINRATLRMLSRRGAMDLGPHHYVVMPLEGGNGRQ